MRDIETASDGPFLWLLSPSGAGDIGTLVPIKRDDMTAGGTP